MLNSDAVGDYSTVSNHTKEVIRSALKAEDPVLIESPPASGKTTSTFELAAESDTPLTYLSARTDLYEQAKQWSKDHPEADLSVTVIPSPHRDCPTFQDDEIGDEQTARKLYQKGYSGREIHYLPAEKAYTPCAGQDCPYLENLNEVENELEDIDLLVGHYSHARREWYIRNRVVIFDEFGTDSFLEKYPSDRSSIVDDPGEIISKFLRDLNQSDADFPVEELSDITDFIQHRDNSEVFEKAVSWFEKHGASRRKAEEYDFFEPTTQRHDRTNLFAPFLTLALLCMEKVGPGIEVAAPHNQRLEEIWNRSDLAAGSRCVRDRNSGEFYTFTPPNLERAEQVIGLDATPVMELWNLLLSPGVEFDQQPIIDRTEYGRYLNSALNAEYLQIGGGMHNYADGAISEVDRYRMCAIHELAGGKFPLISTKNALTQYEDRGLLDRYISRYEPGEVGDDELLYDHYKAKHYGTIKSSNEFEDEFVGAVFGTPFPGDHIVKIWGGLVGRQVEVEGQGEGRHFGDFGDKIFRHFTHNQVIQAALRFGREDPTKDDTTRVYISTKAVPDWFGMTKTVDVRTGQKETAIIEELRAQADSVDNSARAFLTVSDLQDQINSTTEYEFDISNPHVRTVLNDLADEGLVEVRRDWGKNGADLYRWCEDNTLKEDIPDGEWAVLSEESVYIKSVSSNHSRPIPGVHPDR